MSFVDAWRRHEAAAIGAAIRTRTADDVQRALERTRSGLDLDDLQALLSPAAAPLLERMAQRAHELTLERFGPTMQLYAPLYLTNVCANICSYCGFSAQNRIARKALDAIELAAEADVLKGHGFEHVLLVTGEARRYGTAYLRAALESLRPRFAALSLEVQPLEQQEYETLVAAGTSAVLVYQESYDAEVYRRHHLKGPKMDMAYRLSTPDRLGRAGVKKIGLGALYGLGDWRTESWFIGLHLRYLEQRYWRTRYSISFPRLRPHEGSDIALTPFSERELLQVVCAFRLFDREVELSLSTRECERFRNGAFRLGFTSMSAGSRTNPGGYASAPESLEQFAIGDERSPAAVAAFLRGQGYEVVWKDWDASYDGQALPRVPQARSAGGLRP